MTEEPNGLSATPLPLRTSYTRVRSSPFAHPVTVSGGSPTAGMRTSEGEEYHESLDHIMSSSSDGDGFNDDSDECSVDGDESDSHIPSAALSYDAWISDLSPVEDRRRRLLRHMGLSGDLVLSRPPPLLIPRPRDPEIGRPASYRRLSSYSRPASPPPRPVPVVARSRSAYSSRPLVPPQPDSTPPRPNFRAAIGHRIKSQVNWLKNIKNIAMNRPPYRGGDVGKQFNPSQIRKHFNPSQIRSRPHGKHCKELSSLFMTQEIRAHIGAVWCMKFNFDGKYLASAGEDRVVHVWEVGRREREGEFLMQGGENANCNPFVVVVGNRPENMNCNPFLAAVESASWSGGEENYGEKKRGKVGGHRRSVTLDHVMVPECVFELSEKPFISFRGHLDEVLDLSWSKSQYLLSSSMDKTVRLWHLSSNSCLKLFSHSDYVTCIQFNPVDDRYFISGSLDEKVRLWNIPNRLVVDWNDLHEMVTAVCYTPDGQSALVGSHKGSCHRYDTSDNKLQERGQIALHDKKKKPNSGKITGFQFAPGSSTEVIVTSVDSSIRVVDGTELVHKFKGFRNTSSQLSATLSPNGKYVICASEDSHVYIWRYESDSRPSSGCNGVVTVTRSYEYFPCDEVTTAVPWPNSSTGEILGTHGDKQNDTDIVFKSNQQVLVEVREIESLPLSTHRQDKGPQTSSISNTNTSHNGDIISATWPEEKLLMTNNKSGPRNNDICHEVKQVQSRSAWGMVIVTAGRGGQIRAFQNFGFPVRT